MKNPLSKIRIISLIVFLLQLALIIAFGIIYFNNYFGAADIISDDYCYMGFGTLVIFDIIWLWVLLGAFEISKRKSDLKVADLIGQDIQEAYNFGMIGLVVVDEAFTVLWVNDLFAERQIDILNTNLFEWQPSLQTLITNVGGTTEKVVINSRNYEVKFLKDAGLFIFKDITDLETITDFSRKQSTVIGQIIFDNYLDVSESGYGDDLTSQIREIIVEYCKDNNVLLKNIRNDAYVFVCNYESIAAMEKDKFSLLDEIRVLGKDRPVSPTISIGIAYDFPDVNKLNEMATSAIEIAMSRGGDQVVVSQYGEELLFYGGKSIAQETKNKVKVRVMADSVCSLIKESSNVIIMGHSMMDMDALGACLGMKAICDYCKKDAILVYEPRNVEKKVKSAVTSYFDKEEISFFVNESHALNELRNNTLLILCDVHKPSITMSPKLLEKANKVMVIDHHRRGEESVESPIFATIDPSASSASEIVAELVYYSSANPRIVIPEEYATVMLSGIYLDSNYFKNTEIGSNTFEASMILKEFGADNTKADEFLKDELEEYALVNKIVSTLKSPYFGVVYCVADPSDIIDASLIAKAANQCMQMKGVNAAFVLGRSGTDEVKISCRSDGSINVQIIAEKLNGGGHFSKAAASLKKISLAQAETKLLEILESYLDEARTGGEK